MEAVTPSWAYASAVHRGSEKRRRSSGPLFSRSQQIRVCHPGHERSTRWPERFRAQRGPRLHPAKPVELETSPTKLLAGSYQDDPAGTWTDIPPVLAFLAEQTMAPPIFWRHSSPWPAPKTPQMPPPLANRQDTPARYAHTARVVWLADLATISAAITVLARASAQTAFGALEGRKTPGRRRH
jgi:hypothetical protein